MSVPPSKTRIDIKLEDLTDNDDIDPLITEDGDPVDKDGKAIFDSPMYDMLINTKVALPNGDEINNAKVIGRSKDSYDQYIKVYNDNPLLDSTVYDVQFPDGTIKPYSANGIADNMYRQVNEDGFPDTTFECIVDHNRDKNAVPDDKKYIITKSGQKRFRKFTLG